MPERSPAARSRAWCWGRWATCRPSRSGASPRTSGATSSPSGDPLRDALGPAGVPRDTAADTITAILTKEPPDLSQTNKDVHPGLDRIVRHCLEKNPEERFQSARDVAFDLEALSGVSTPTGVIALPRRSGAVAPAALLAAVLARAAVLASGTRNGKKAGFVQPPSFRQITFRRGRDLARFAPDGQTIVYAAAWDGKPFEIFINPPESPESRPFGLVAAEVLSISNSGEMAVS